jgi:hypothetical protein
MVGIPVHIGDPQTWGSRILVLSYGFLVLIIVRNPGPQGGWECIAMHSTHCRHHCTMLTGPTCLLWLCGVRCCTLTSGQLQGDWLNHKRLRSSPADELHGVTTGAPVHRHISSAADTAAHGE